MNTERDRPFMICSSFFGPHFPYCVPEPYDEMYDPETVERWVNFDEQFVDKPSIQQKEMLRWNASHLTWPDWQKVIATYWGYCTFIDDQVKRVLYALERAGQLDNTVIIYSSDHGDMLGSHRLFNKMMNMYNETHQIPGELHNLAPKLGYKHVLRRMKDRMVKWLRDTNDGIVNDGGWQSNSYDLFVSGRER